MKSKFILNVKFILLFPGLAVLNYISSFYPQIVESYFSSGINKTTVQFLSTVTGIFPFSLAEFLIILLSIILLFLFIFFIKNLLYSSSKVSLIFRGSINFLICFSIVYSSFIVIWGLNYHRLPLSQIAGFKTEPTTVHELAELCEFLIEKSNYLRNKMIEDENGVMKTKDGIYGVLARAEKGFVNASNTIPELGGKFGKPKKVLFSDAMSYAGIAGIYFPFTGEANVNTSIPLSMLPSTTSHEMAHQRGFAREDEANYIAYLTCKLHPDKDFQYSGYLLALIHSMNALARYDREQYSLLSETYGTGLKKDLIYIRNYWKQYEGPVEKATTKMNNAYLKSNLQEDGIYSYGRMVDLLLAEFKSQK